MLATADLRPLLGRRGRPGAARFLLVCFYDPTGIATIHENVAMWQRHSQFELEVLNLWPTRGARLNLPSTLDLAEYDGIIIHAAVSYSLENLEALDTTLARPFEQYDGVKVLMRQDEQQRTALFAGYLRRKRFDVLLSCVPEAEWAKTYPRSQVGDLAIVQVLTGYVSRTMRDMATPWSPSRPIDIGYRGSIQPLQFGRLGFEKRKIGDDVRRALAGRSGMRLDISNRSEDRFGGSAWLDFLTASKATLGVESGSNLFDFDGKVEEWCRSFEAVHPEMDRLSEAFYCLADAEHLRRFEGNVDYAQVSPRHFEAAAAASVQVLYQGRYSNIFVPHKHFLPLARDLSNLNEVIDALADERRCTELAECSFAEIVRNPRYGYEAFVATVDAALDGALACKGQARRAAKSAASRRPRAVILTAADPVQDPRFGWFATSLACDHEVCEIGTYRMGVEGGGPSAERLADDRWRLRVERTRHGAWWVPPATAVDRSLSLGRQKLLYLAMLADASETLLRSSIGALDAEPEDIAQFRALAQHVLNSSAALLEAAQRTGRFDLVVATDLDTLPAGVVLRDEIGALLLYDANEFWPYAVHGMRHWQCEFWAAFGRELVAQADFAVTVSPPLAKVMAAEYGREFTSVPNCASLGDAAAVDIEYKLAQRARREEVIFLYQGAFAPGRGIERLISAWQHVNARGRLLLRGPDWEHKTAMVGLARSLGLLDRTVFFPPAVAEEALIFAASEADFGVIPYEPVTVNNRFACPNKLSQYLAAGLPVICNQLEFVRALVVENSLGHVIDLSDEKASAGVFDKVIAAADELPTAARRARSYFERHFHWEEVFEPLGRRLHEAERTRPGPQSDQPLDLLWVNDIGAMRSRLAGESQSARRSKTFADELHYFHTHYPEMVASLNDEITRLNEIVAIRSDFARLIRVRSDRFTRAVRAAITALRLRADVIRLVFSDAGGFAALAVSAKEGCFDRAFLAQAARVIAARKLALTVGGPAGALAAYLADGVLELRAQPARNAQKQLPSFTSRTEVATAAATRRIRSLTLTIDAGIAARPALLAEGGYELPELLRWFERRPDLAAALIWGSTGRDAVDTGRAVVF